MGIKVKEQKSTVELNYFQDEVIRTTQAYLKMKGKENALMMYSETNQVKGEAVTEAPYYVLMGNSAAELRLYLDKLEQQT